MHGLVIGIHVKPSPGHVAYDAPNARDIRLLVQRKPNRLLGGLATAYGFVIQKGDSVPPRDSVDLPAPVLELKRGKPVRITVVNNLQEPTGIHWHGLEIPSFPDGVPNWSGMGDRVFAPIAPGESFVAAFTPPRSGTFPYHSHLNERAPDRVGDVWCDHRDRHAARSRARSSRARGRWRARSIYAKIESPYAMVNGRVSPEPLRLTAGEMHRIRIVSIHPDWRISFTLRNDSTVARWRAIAKDGARPACCAGHGAIRESRHGPGRDRGLRAPPIRAG